MSQDEAKTTVEEKSAASNEPKKNEAVKSSTHSQQAVTPFDKREPTKGMLLTKIYTPFKTFFEGDARSLTAVNETGTFDVLPGHHNFITMLLPCDVVVETAEREKQVVPIRRGLMHVKQNRLIIFLDV